MLPSETVRPFAHDLQRGDIRDQFGTAAVTAIGDVAQDVTSYAIINATLGWNKEAASMKKLQEKTEKLAYTRTALGFHESLDRSSFAISPLVKRLSDMTYGEGKVYVAYVSSGLGKTTACRIFLSGMGHKVGQGIAFCPLASKG